MTHHDSLVARIKAYHLPGGEDLGRGVRGIRATQRGEIRSRPYARWNPFTAEEFVDATKAGFCWEARMGTGLTSILVTDAYEDGRGRLTVSKGPIRLKKLDGPDVDKGELQRYLAYLCYCPAMLVNNPSLALTPIGPLTLRVTDTEDQTGASVEIDFAEDGQTLVSRAVRPMTVGKRIIPTPWSASGSHPRVWDGLCATSRLEASWHPPEGAFVYIRMEITSFTVLR